MVSSRCRDRVSLRGKEVAFSELRKEIKRLVTGIAPFGEPLFECWINEDAPAAEGSRDSWERCLDEVRRSDILLVLYNGNPGWAREPGDVGICHAELQTALASGAAKVFAIELPIAPVPTKPEERGRFTCFQEYVASQSLFVSTADDGDAAIGLVPQIFHEAVTELVMLGGREARKGRFDTGEALDWSRLDFEARKAAVEDVARKALMERGRSMNQGKVLYVRVTGSTCSFAVHAIPSGLRRPSLAHRMEAALSWQAGAGARKRFGTGFPLRQYMLANSWRTRRPSHG
jgi:hypothetical protein